MLSKACQASSSAKEAQVWEINDDGAVPPLPRKVIPKLRISRQSGTASNFSDGPLLKPGCWIMQLSPFFADDEDPRLAETPKLHGWTIRYIGTMRIECPTQRDKQGNKKKSGCIVASGDLYVDRQIWSQARLATPPDLPQPDEIPIYARSDYSFYVTLKEITIEDQDVAFTIATYYFDRSSSSWGPGVPLTARFATNASENNQRSSPKSYLCGCVYNDDGTRIGKLEMCWVSDYLRAARIEVAVAAGLRAPLDNGKGRTLKKVFKKIGWKLKIDNPVDAAGPSDVWQASDLHTKMLELRTAANLDLEWLYHVLVVPRFYAVEENGFGKMYDQGALDTDLIPREGLVVAAEAKFPQDPKFGSASGQKLRDVPPAAFHNLVHELGHAMGLLHRFQGTDFMQALVQIASQATPHTPFPENLSFRFDPRDENRLRHHPDMWVRPGGAAFGQGFAALPIPDADAITDVSDQFELLVKPLWRIVPLGAPVKLQLRLRNKSASTLPGPSVLSLSAGSVSGRVIGPNGDKHTFSAASPLDFVTTADLPPGQALTHGETLWRGPEGALFPAPGYYQIEVGAGWVGPGGIAGITSSCQVLVATPRDHQHELVALDLLATEDIAVLLVFQTSPGTIYKSVDDRINYAVQVLQNALEVKELRIILATIEAIRLACCTNLREAAIRLEEDSLMTTTEIESLLTMVEQAGTKVQKDSLVRRMVAICQAKAREFVSQGLALKSLLDLAEKASKAIEAPLQKEHCGTDSQISTASGG